MNNRQIELHADGNDRGYRVSLIINGREFSGQYHCGNHATDVYHQIAHAVEEVYGEPLYTNALAHADIYSALSCAAGIIRELHKHFRKG